jgi:N-acetylneuraminic acid mutarotase
MKKTISLVMVLVLGLVSVSLAAKETWTMKSPMPKAISLHSASVVDGKIYVIGGTDNLYQWADYFSTVFVYNPETDNWTKKADMSRGRARLSTSVVDGKIYAIGGSPHRDAEVSTVEAYDPATDTWTRKTDMPRARNWHSTSVVNGKIYAIGGKIYPSATMVSTVEEYDPVTDAWTRKADMPTARSMHSASVVNGKIYVIGGVTTEGGGGPGLSMVEVYEPATNNWTRKADMPTARKALSTGVVNGKIYAVGGTTGWQPCFSTVEEYDPSTDTWTKKADMPTARGCHSVSVVDGKIYVIGGVLNPSGWQPCFSTVEVYDSRLTDPPPDFNGDGTVNIRDLLRLIESWGQNDPTVDIAPTFGDGIVDALDLELLMSYWKQPIDDPTLIAHWGLDEAEGNIAYDSAGVNDASVVGEHVWQPDAGKIGGALALDGIDDCVVAPHTLNPADGPFSVFAWVQGGAPGQVVISQLNGANWLGADNTLGSLMTQLCTSGRGGGPLQSATDITDGSWHRIGLVWDGVYRVIYVDDIPVAEDTQRDLEGCTGGLKIGGGIDSATGTFWAGLIDDVRIYNRAVSP